MKHECDLTVEHLAEALYAGTACLSNLAENLARKYGKAGALSFFGLMDDDVQNFWRGIAKQLVDHASEWEANDGSCCVLSENEQRRLAELPRVGEKMPEIEVLCERALREIADAKKKRKRRGK